MPARPSGVTATRRRAFASSCSTSKARRRRWRSCTRVCFRTRARIWTVIWSATSPDPDVQEVMRRPRPSATSRAARPACLPWRTSRTAAVSARPRGLRALADGRDRKSPGLKLLQGLIWEEGYQAGELHGEVFEDVPARDRTLAGRGPPRRDLFLGQRTGPAPPVRVHAWPGISRR